MARNSFEWETGRSSFASAHLLVGPGLLGDVWLSPKDVARLLRVSISTLARSRKSGGGPRYRVRRRKILYRPSDVFAWWNEVQLARCAFLELRS